MNSISFNSVGYTTNFRGLGGLFVVAANNKLRNDSNSSKKDDYYRGPNHGLTFSDSKYSKSDTFIKPETPYSPQPGHTHDDIYGTDYNNGINTVTFKDGTYEKYYAKDVNKEPIERSYADGTIDIFNYDHSITRKFSDGTSKTIYW